jgi:hypothetical protein
LILVYLVHFFRFGGVLTIILSRYFGIKAGSGTSDSRIPPQQNYAILYEMEHVETRLGYYTSTEGFLLLLNALFACCSPSDLGHRWRIRSGCTPYIEFILHHVLPRATGSDSTLGKLPFRSKGDQARLVALALEVVESVLTRYSFQIPRQKTLCPTTAEASDLLKQSALAEKVVLLNGANANLQDFENRPVHIENRQPADPGGFQSPQSGASLRGAPASVPAPKSPGFVVLADILSATDGNIFKAIGFLLGDSVTSVSLSGYEAAKVADAYALFGGTPPTTASAKHLGSKERNPSNLRATLLKEMRPYLDSLSYSEAVYWKEQGICHALQILCASAVREEVFYGAVNALASPLRIVPVLRFEKRSPMTASQIRAYNIHLSRLKDLLKAAREVLAATVEYIGYTGSCDEHDISIAMAGLSLVFFLHKAFPSPISTQVLCGNFSGGYQRLSRAVARRMVVSFERPDSPLDAQILSLTFNWILSDLRRDERSSLSQALLGLPDSDTSRSLASSVAAPKDCFDAILKLLGDPHFISDSKTSLFAANCFEILVRLCDLKRASEHTAWRQVQYSSERLRKTSFWKTKLLFFMRNEKIVQSVATSGDEQVLHSLAWLLKGVASELHMLMGFCPRNCEVLVGYLAPRPGECKSLMALLFGGPWHWIENVIADLPLERMHIDSYARLPSQDSICSAMHSLEGSVEVTDGYLVVDERILLSKLSEKDHAEEFSRWCSSWNASVKLDCGISHLSDAVRVLVGSALVCLEADFEMRIDSLATLLETVLSRLSDSCSSPQLSSTATRNLSWIALLLSRVIATVADEGKLNGANLHLRNIRDLFARSVVGSGWHMKGVEAVRHNERTAILSVALVEIMGVHEIEADVDPRTILDVALVLAQLSCLTQGGNRTSPEAFQGAGASLPSPSDAAILARSSLSALIQICDREVKSPSESLAYNLLTNPLPFRTNEKCLQPLLRILVDLDDGIIPLLKTVVEVPFVGNLLLDAGLLKAFLDAADKYMEEERRLMTLSSQQGGGQKIVVGFPSFFRKHLELLSTIMATSRMLSDEHCRSLPRYFIDILAKYEVVIQRSFADFASNGPELCVLIQCVAQASLLSSDREIMTGNPLGPVHHDRVSFRGSFIEQAILDLLVNLAEHPFPSNFLSPLPHSLANTENLLSSSVVVVSASKKALWWDSERLSPARRHSNTALFEDWTEAMFEHAILGADILGSGLKFFGGIPPKTFAVEASFVRGLFQLSKAASVSFAQYCHLFLSYEGLH